MTKQIKYECSNCGHIEKKTNKDLFFSGITNLIFVLGLFFSIYLVVVGPVDVLMDVGDTILDMNAMRYQGDFRKVVMNYTTYDGSDSFDFAFDLLQNLPRIRYMYTSKEEVIGNLQETWDYKTGDCKQDAMLFVSLMGAAGYDANVDCSLEDQHCVARIPHNQFSEFRDTDYMIVDLTGDMALIYHEDVDHWENPYGFIALAEHDKR